MNLKPLLPPRRTERYESVTRPPAAKPVKRQAPPGIEHVYEELQRRLAQQREAVDRIDSKAAVLIGFLGVLLVGVASVPKQVLAVTLVHVGVVILVGLSLVSGLVSLWPREWQSPPNPHKYVTYTEWSKDQALASEFDGVYASVVVNGQMLESKLWWFSVCLTLLAAAVGLFVVGNAVGVAIGK